MPTTITVKGMSCEGCERAVKDALEDVSSVTSATVDRSSETATIDGNAEVTDLVAAVNAAGYEAST